jgi:hypothetical protein
MAMTPSMSDQTASAGRVASQRVLLGLAAIAGLLVAATAALWAHYGTAMFYEMIVAGINACF